MLICRGKRGVKKRHRSSSGRGTCGSPSLCLLAPHLSHHRQNYTLWGLAVGGQPSNADSVPLGPGLCPHNSLFWSPPNLPTMSQQQLQFLLAAHQIRGLTVIYRGLKLAHRSQRYEQKIFRDQAVGTMTRNDYRNIGGSNKERAGIIISNKGTCISETESNCNFTKNGEVFIPL